MYPNQYVSKFIEYAIADELDDSRFYSDLSDRVTDIEDKKMLKEMSIDEMKHSKMLSELYNEINNANPQINEEERDNKNQESILNSFANAIQGETNAVEKYRTLLFAFEKPEYKNMITEIITDEQNHSAKLNYLYSKNK